MYLDQIPLSHITSKEPTFEEWLNFAAATPGGVKRKCVKPTAFPCGNSCVAGHTRMGKPTQCKKPLQGQAKDHASWLKTQATAHTAGKNPTKESIPKTPLSPGSHRYLPDYLKNDKKTVTALSNEMGVSEPRAGYIAKTLFDWSNDDYTEIRKLQQEGKTSPQIKAMDEYLSKMPPYEGTISRGLEFESESEKKSFLDNIAKNGMTLNAHSSFSSNKKIAQEFAGLSTGTKSPNGVVIIAQNKSGRSIHAFSELKEEREVVVPIGTKYKIEKTTESRGVTYVHVKEY